MTLVHVTFNGAMISTGYAGESATLGHHAPDETTGTAEVIIFPRPRGWDDMTEGEREVAATKWANRPSKVFLDSWGRLHVACHASHPKAKDFGPWRTSRELTAWEQASVESWPVYLHDDGWTYLLDVEEAYENFFV